MDKARRKHPATDANPPPAAPELGLDEFEAEPSDEGLSLEELSRAYAEAIGSGEDPYEDLPDDDVPDDDVQNEEQGLASDESGISDDVGSGESSSPAGDESGSGRDACAVSPGSILEAILFVGHPENRPLTSREIASLMRGVRPSEIDDLVQELNQIYDATDSPYWIRSVEAGYLMQLRPEYESVRDVFYGRVKAARLSQAAIDVLAIVAYNQPVTREQVDQLRSRPSGALLNQLVRRGLLVIERDPDQGRVRRFRTTDRFLHFFQLQSLDELPRSQELS